MKEFAVIKNGLVANVILWDGADNTFADGIDGALISILADTAVGAGWGYDGSTFTPPPEPEKTKEQLIQEASIKKEELIQAANAFINNKQWPGKAAIGRLTGDELAQYNLWLDYLDALEAIDTSSAPAINWPVPPEA
ncbi:tail fiber assembly protein [Trabulsiella odontotermitis]|uniref:tail fiber assembly protein n=1 Tax=Trabulsiella odontotermitis TaxID=379893 RepID=UPI00067619AD|nr:tail fiber assembly protein [Trabulsiella odontotermitis]KNC89875.1 phage tail fiber protein [Trabulsiella odontotermitis]